jgi:predicted AlkP superfamily phosphohydrolase/phosphomutase
MSGRDARSRRTLVVGMEMGDGRLIRRWCDEGRLPTLTKLLQDGRWSWLGTTADALHVSAWPSLYTGTNPGKHGVYYTFQPRSCLQGYSRFSPGIYGEPTFWQLLSRNGRRCIVFDAPYTEPEPGFAGIQVFDWGTWAQYLGTSSVPKDVVKSLQRNCGHYPLGLEAHDIGLVAWDADNMEQRLTSAVEAKARATVWMMKEYEWDLFFTVFGETHPAAHYCWPDDDRGEFDAPQLLRIYQALDSAIAKIVDAAGDDTSVFIVSGDGVGPNHSGWHLLPEVLEKLGYFVAGGSTPDDEADATPQKGRFDPVKALRNLLPKDFRKALARKLPTALRDKLAQRVDTADIDWSRTRAFCLPTDLEGYIRVNLRGREPQGIVEPGEEYQTVCRDLARNLRELKNPETGEAAVREVIITTDDLPGPHTDQLPDIVVCWSDAARISSLESEAIGTVSGDSPDGRTGTHRPPGFILAKCGDGVSIDFPEEAHIFDFAPTLLDGFGIEKPSDMDGTAWPVRVSPEHRE